ncbi:hypothetical protein [Shouchella lehensis]|uniref:Uncharacterized protein n=1 Tax=Shouchella lehensis TaxID=300825 RepID=A0A4Y7WLE6_9BACI|nr:hypothetical protein [Shouchella lehensis]MBG9783473.1 hypothetical protein [Shouchella lehensis]TES49134.1 hypothetical protein E2L03_06520 [Shouchella lehensis]
MLNFVSSTFNLNNRLEELGVFDSLLDIDSYYFINIKRLETTTIAEFKDSYHKINKIFEKIALLLKKSKNDKDRFYKAALDLFYFPEVNGLGLGYADGKHGSGLGKKLRQKVISDAKQIIAAGEDSPEIFHLVGLFERNIGPDRISDMIAHIIKEDIIAYTKRINTILEINAENYPEFSFEDGLLINPYKKTPLLLLPIDILHELPIAKDWDDIDRVCNQVNILKAEINDIIGDKWKDMSVGNKKDVLSTLFIENPGILTSTLNVYRGISIDQYDFIKDKTGDFIIAKVADNLPSTYPITLGESTKKSTYNITKTICEKFKDLIENNNVSDLLYYEKKPRNEKAVQKAFLCVADSYCNAFNIGISPETDSGRGPVDFKFETSYTDRTLVEIKLASSQNLVHGMQVQLEEYKKAEKTLNSIYLVVNLGNNEKKLEQLNTFYSNNKGKEGCPELIIVDATPKESASKFKPKK